MDMSLRASLMDELCNQFFTEHPDAVIIHLGCGLGSRCLRVNQNYKIWYDLDYENVIQIRKNYYRTDHRYKLIGSSVSDFEWLEHIEDNMNVLVVAEGLTMYLSEEEIRNLIGEIQKNSKMLICCSTRILKKVYEPQKSKIRSTK